MSTLTLLGWNALALFAAMTLVWVFSLPLRNASIVDIFWGLGFVLVAWLTHTHLPSGQHADLLTLLATLWGVRLSGYLALRNLGHGEDKRYVTIRQNNPPFWIKSLFIVFWLQAALLFVVSLPLQLGQAPRARGFTWLDALGTALFVIGFLFEAVADWQLRRFKQDPSNRGLVMDRGLWRYSRHPNYFGEIVLWWGLGIMALSTPGAWPALLGPLTITFLLLRVSGVTLLEKDMKKRPGYAQYVARTSAVWPRKPAN